MLRSTTASSLVSLAILLAAAGCMTDSLQVADGLAPAAEALSLPPLGHEVHHMLYDEKRDAVYAELPAQF